MTKRQAGALGGRKPKPFTEEYKNQLRRRLANARLKKAAMRAAQSQANYVTKTIS